MACRFCRHPQTACVRCIDRSAIGIVRRRQCSAMRCGILVVRNLRPATFCHSRHVAFQRLERPRRLPQFTESFVVKSGVGSRVIIIMTISERFEVSTMTHSDALIIVALFAVLGSRNTRVSSDRAPQVHCRQRFGNRHCVQSDCRRIGQAPREALTVVLVMLCARSSTARTSRLATAPKSRILQFCCPGRCPEANSS